MVSRDTRWMGVLASLILGALVSAGVVRGLDLIQDERAVPSVREGYVVFIDQDGDGIALADRPNDIGAGYMIGLAAWRREGETAWTLSNYPPACVQPGQKVRLGVVRILPREAPGGEFVAWLECLGEG